MESLFFSTIKEYLPPITVLIIVIVYLVFQNKTRAKEAEEIKQFIDKRFKSVEQKFDKIFTEIAELHELYHKLDTEQKERYHELDKKILKQESNYVEKLDFISLINDTNRRFEVLHKTLIERDEKFRAEIKELFHIALKNNNNGAGK